MSDAPPAVVLEAWGFTGAQVTAFESGLVNRHWLVSSRTRQVVLRRYTEQRTLEAASWEQALVAFAAEHGWAVAAPVAANDGRELIESEGRLWAAMPFLRGQPLEDSSEAHYHTLGRLVARLHAGVSGFPVEGQRPGFGQAWDLDAWVAPFGGESFDALVGRLAEVEPDLGGLIRKERERCLAELSAAGFGELPRLPVHGDFQRFNLLWDGGELTGILDFDFARRDAQVCDLATMLVPFMPLEAAQMAALLAGYEAVRALTAAERQVLPPLVRALLLCWVALLLGRWQFATEAGVPPALVRTMTKRLPAVVAAESAWRGVLGI